MLLDLRGTELGDEGAEQLALGLQSGTPGILNLNVDGTGIGDKGMVALMEQLIKTKTVRMILLSNNPIGAEGANAAPEVATSPGDGFLSLPFKLKGSLERLADPSTTIVSRLLRPVCEF